MDTTSVRFICRSLRSLESMESKMDRLLYCHGMGKESTGISVCNVEIHFTDETRNIYESLNLSETDAKDTEKIIDVLEKFAKGIVNETLERHLFNSRCQEEGELFDDFLTYLKILSKNCGFCGSCHDSLVRDRIVAGINDDQLRKRLLSDSKLDLQEAENTCRSYEKATQGMEALNESKTEINLVQSRTSYKQNRLANIQHHQKPRAEQKTGPRQKPCKFCCRQHQWGR